MTENEALDMMKAKLKCTELDDLACIENGCDRNCDNCDLNYEQGNSGQQKESMAVAIKALEEIQQYRSIGTVEECLEAMERQRAKKPLSITHCKDGNHPLSQDIGRCPSCNSIVAEDMLWCDDCGQLLDWSDNP